MKRSLLNPNASGTGSRTLNHKFLLVAIVLASGDQISYAGGRVLDLIFPSGKSPAPGSRFQDCEIRLAEQVEDAGMLGGAALAFEAQKWAK